MESMEMITRTKIKWLSKVPVAYLNWASQTRVSEELNQSILANQAIFNRLCVSAGKGYDMLYDKIEAGRNLLSIILGNINTEKIIFTSGATHGLELVCHSLIKKRSMPCYVTSQEFPSTVHTLHTFIDKITTLSFANLEEEIDQLNNSETECLFLVSHIAYDTGSILPVSRIIKKIKWKFPKAIVVLDGSQAVGNIKVDLSKLGIDAYIFNTNKWLLGSYTGILIISNLVLLKKILPCVQSPFSVTANSHGNKCSSTGLNLCYAASLEESLKTSLLLLNSANFAEHKLKMKSMLIQSLQTKLDFTLLDNNSLNSSSGIISLAINNSTPENIVHQWKIASEYGCHFHVFRHANFKNKLGPAIIRIAIHSVNNESDILSTADLLKNYFNNK